MSESDAESSTLVRVSQKGQTTIPKQLREEHGIDAPGRVRVRSTDKGVLIERVSPPAESTGELQDLTDEEGRTPTERLRDEREVDARGEEY